MHPFGGYICTGFCARLSKDQIRNCHSDKEEGKSAPPVTIKCDSSVFFKSKWAEAVLSRGICPIIYIKVHCSSA